MLSSKFNFMTDDMGQYYEESSSYPGYLSIIWIHFALHWEAR